MPKTIIPIPPKENALNSIISMALIQYLIDGNNDDNNLYLL